MKSCKLLILILLTHLASTLIFAQTEDKPNIKPCAQNFEEKRQLIKEAEENQFNVLNIYVAGSTYTRHRIFVNQMAFVEGDIFTERNLIKSIDGINKLKTVYPLALKDVEIRLLRDTRDIDITFCVVQKEKK